MLGSRVVGCIGRGAGRCPRPPVRFGDSLVYGCGVNDKDEVFVGQKSVVQVAGGGSCGS